MTMAGRAIDFASLAVLGPLIAQRWQFEDPGCPWPITAELWKRGDGKRLMEVSIKAPAVQAAVAMGGFMAFLAEVGAERDTEQQTKTRWALDYYVGKLARPPARRKAAGKTSAAKTPRPAGTQVVRCKNPPAADAKSWHSAFEDDAHRGAGSRSGTSDRRSARHHTSAFERACPHAGIRLRIARVADGRARGRGMLACGSAERAGRTGCKPAGHGHCRRQRPAQRLDVYRPTEAEQARIPWCCSFSGVVEYGRRADYRSWARPWRRAGDGRHRRLSALSAGALSSVPGGSAAGRGLDRRPARRPLGATAGGST